MNARTQASQRRASALRFSLLALLVMVGSTLSVFGGCALNTHGTLGTGGGTPVPCSTAADCDDDNPCTKDSCGADKTCLFAKIASGPAPDKDQQHGDCKTIQCTDGEPSDVVDTNDLADDHEDCTIDGCNQDGPYHTAKPDNTTCTSADGDPGVCDHGVCKVRCGPTMPCPDPGPCATVSCDAASGSCVKQPLQDGMTTPGYTDTQGDCQTHVCINGDDTGVADDSDVPNVPECDIPNCTNGVPSPTHKQQHVTCTSFMGSQAGYCDGNGHCVQCTEDADCPGVIDDCKRPHCDPATFTCSTAFTPVNTSTTTTPAQTIGDCQEVVCDGAGGTTIIPNASDTADDLNACTTDTCGSGTTTNHTPLAPGTACGNGLTCNSQVKCAGCSMNSMCPQASCNGTTLTKSQTCDGMGNCVSNGTQNCAPYLCNAGANSCTTSCNTDNDCAAGNYCTGANGQCKPKVPQGSSCGSNHECSNNTCVDGFCCNSTCGGTCFSCNGGKTGGANGTCLPIPSGQDPDNECADQGAASCGTNGVCDGTGACAKYAAGTQCAASSCAGGTLTKAKQCNGSGTCVTPTPATVACAPYLCGGSPAACTTTCNNDPDCASTAFCTGNQCFAKKTSGSTCPTGAHECTSTFCVDGFCCNSACNTACQACSAAKKNTGSDGACGAAKDGVADPRNICMSTAQNMCGTDGLCKAGACEDYPAGTSCAPSTCTGGNMLTNAKSCDGSGTCASSGSTGPCPNHLICQNGTSCRTDCGGNDANCTPSTYYCDGTNTCQAKKADGTGCGGNHECTSSLCGTTGTGNCCTGTCTTGGTCGASGCDTGGACNYPTTACSTCSGGNMLTPGTCNGSGSCTTGTAGPCPNNLKCQDGTQCWSGCGMGGSADNTKCATGYQCDPTSGTCKLPAGSATTCNMDTDCVSGSCGGNGVCCAAACTTGGTCGATGCAPVTGLCVYPPLTTPCSICNTTTNQLSTGSCTGTGTCNTVSGPADCANNLKCQDATQCWTSCKNGSTQDDTRCATGTCQSNGHCQ